MRKIVSFCIHRQSVRDFRADVRLCLIDNHLDTICIIDYTIYIYYFMSHSIYSDAWLR